MLRLGRRPEAEDSHCQARLQNLPAKQHGMITYCRSLARLEYRPTGATHGAH